MDDHAHHAIRRCVDPFYPVRLADEMYAALLRPYLWIIPNGGHCPIFGPIAPRFVETATAFLRGEWHGA
jgi:pimeloyl-ACP methyl ester carboxylesterase